MSGLLLAYDGKAVNDNKTFTKRVQEVMIEIEETILKLIATRNPNTYNNMTGGSICLPC